jgi:2-polyprenyl-3-methyl-5-hydroxy-6-metoxy-1,4-benzoquinol methylase
MPDNSIVASASAELTSGKVYGGTFDAADRNNPRTIIANWVAEESRVLEVGPGDGVVSRWLKQAKRCQVIGVELVPEAAQAASASGVFECMLVGSIEDDAVIAQACACGPFDVIIFADVLEHLVDPWRVLRQMRGLLAPSGHVLLSVPNVAHWTARLNLLRGRFDYTDGYLMDRTHLRWFTWRTAREMAKSSGYAVAAEDSVFKPRFLRFWRTFSGFQIVLKLKPA